MKREFLDVGREGFHQLAWWAAGFDAVIRKADNAGWSVAFWGDSGDVRFAYFELDPLISTLIEVMELTDSAQGFADLVAVAAAGWMASPTLSGPLSEALLVGRRPGQLSRTVHEVQQDQAERLELSALSYTGRVFGVPVAPDTAGPCSLSVRRSPIAVARACPGYAFPQPLTRVTIVI